MKLTRDQADVMTIDGLQVYIFLRKVKNLYLSIQPPDGWIKITAPLSTSEEQIIDLVRAKRTWIDRHQLRVKDRFEHKPVIRPEVFKHDEYMYLWGKPVRLDCSECGKKNVTLEHTSPKVLHVCAPQGSTIQRYDSIVNQWLRCELLNQTDQMVNGLLPNIGVKPKSIQFYKMKARWGSCQPATGIIRINPDLVHLHPDCLYYVLIHELVHLLEPSHSKRFKDLMTKYLPSWKTHKELLDSGGIKQLDQLR